MTIQIGVVFRSYAGSSEMSQSICDRAFNSVMRALDVTCVKDGVDRFVFNKVMSLVVHL